MEQRLSEFEKRQTALEPQLKEFFETVENIALKCAKLVEKRMEDTKELKKDDLNEIHSAIQMLNHTTAILERLGHIKKLRKQ